MWGGGGSGAGPNNGCARGGGDYNSCGTTVGFDCSGLTAYVLGMAGYQTPGDSGSQRVGRVPRSAGRRRCPVTSSGFPGHVAVYLGTFGGRPYILEASWVGTPIHIVPLTRTDFDDRVHRYWTGPAVQRARRRRLLGDRQGLLRVVRDRLGWVQLVGFEQRHQRFPAHLRAEHPADPAGAVPGPRAAGTRARAR